MKFRPASDDFYKQIGFKSGLEIHQQLYTEKKLFCRCPAGKYSYLYDVEVLRHMRPTLSELGEYDGTALMEFKTKKDIIYRMKSESVCTYEMDDTPPFLVNEQALDIGIEISLMLNCQIVDEIHISRKQYLDGSIPTGFQRTAIISVNGWIPYKDRKVGITQISIEEDSCREIADEGHTIYFRTDRLGMPLIEIVTEPDMVKPDEVAEVAEIIGRIMRATGKVRTGPGATRQDVNVSANGGTRIEIKGVPSIKWIPALTHFEALRQVALVELKNEFAKRELTKDNLETEELDLTYLLRDSKSDNFQRALQESGRIRGIVMRNMQGMLLHDTQPGKTFFHEIAGRIRVIACLDKMPNAYHTDHYPDYEKSSYDYMKIRDAFKMNDNDVAIIVWGSDGDVKTACSEVRIRIEDAMLGIPSETRQPFPAGINDFERILPGANRMYPDTDLPPHAVTQEHIEELRKNLKPSPIKRSNRYQELGLTFRVARALSISPFAALIEELVDKGISIKMLQRIFFEHNIALRRKSLHLNDIQESSMRNMFELLLNKKITQDVLGNFIEILAATPVETIDTILAEKSITPISDDEVEKLVAEVISENQEKLAKKPKRQLSPKPAVKFLMGKLMHGRNLKGSYDGRKLENLVSQKL